MAHGTIDFFAPADPQLGLSSEWVFQDGGALSNSKTRAAELKATGDELASALHDGKATTSFTYIFQQPATAVSVLTFPKVGKVAGGWHIDSWSCAWDRQQLAPKLTVNCHKHTTGTAHTTGSCRTYSPSLVAIAPVDFGVPSTFGTAFALASGAVVDLRSATYSMQVNHVDELNKSGNQLAGDNYDASETLQIELTGAATLDDYTTTWDQTADGTTPTNTGATSSSFTFEHHVAADAAA